MSSPGGQTFFPVEATKRSAEPPYMAVIVQPHPLPVFIFLKFLLVPLAAQVCGSDVVTWTVCEGGRVTIQVLQWCQATSVTFVVSSHFFIHSLRYFDQAAMFVEACLEFNLIQSTPETGKCADYGFHGNWSAFI